MKWKRARLIVAAAALLLIIALLVMRSPFVPSARIAQSMEEVWALEDAREERETIQTEILSSGVPLAYDEETECFYCPLPLEAEEWPSLSMTAERAGVSLLFTDNYLQDDVQDAMAEGIAYELMVYDATGYAYTEVVFTGMEQIQLHTDDDMAAEDLPREDVPASVIVSDGASALTSNGRIHRRGGVTVGSLKPGIRVEFTKKASGKKKIYQEVPGFGAVRNLVLIPMVYDGTLMRDRLSWDIFSECLGEAEPYGQRNLRYVEVFFNDVYQGVYLALEPYDHAEELQKAGPMHPATDEIFRSTVHQVEPDRPFSDGVIDSGFGYELHYASGALSGDPMAGIAEYISLEAEEDDQAFIEKLNRVVDLEDMLFYEAWAQGCGWVDNVFNNMFIWACQTDDGLRYRFRPWDLDTSWGKDPYKIGEAYDGWIPFPVMDRALALNALNLRERLLAIWRALREERLTQEHIEALVNQYEHELNDSGAMTRNSDCWGIEDYTADGYSLVDFAAVRFQLIDQAFAWLASTEETPAWLAPNPSQNYVPIRGIEEAVDSL